MGDKPGVAPCLPLLTAPLLSTMPLYTDMPCFRSSATVIFEECPVATVDLTPVASSVTVEINKSSGDWPVVVGSVESLCGSISAVASYVVVATLKSGSTSELPTLMFGDCVGDGE